MTRTEKPYTFGKTNGDYEIRVLLPFATKGEIGLFKKGDELVVEIGTLRRHIGLPRSMAMLLAGRARLGKSRPYGGNEGGAMNEQNPNRQAAGERVSYDAASAMRSWIICANALAFRQRCDNIWRIRGSNSSRRFAT